MSLTTVKGRDFLSILDFSLRELGAVFGLARDLKMKLKAGEGYPLCAGKTLAMIFQKPSTRTRVSFEVGMHQLGGHALYLNAGDLQLGRGETVADTARVLSRYVDGIMIRTFKQSDVEELARHAAVPVINGLTDWEHPCQIMADFLTILEHKGRLEGLKLAYVGDGNNVAQSLLLGGARVGMRVAMATPPGYAPNPELVYRAAAEAVESGGEIELTNDPVAAVRDADVVMTDTWASMGRENEHDARVALFRPYQVNEALVAHARPDYIFMHCLPAHRGEEVVNAVMDGPHSVIWDEAENRLHVQKALLALLL
ncbi:MAG: ornithine carbamoyltransferase [Candidatus Desulforudis sp.]|nr:ornithine carbamoyltransferase [Desulforudis sp.]